MKQSWLARTRVPVRTATLVTSRPHGTIDHQKNLRNFGPKDARYQMCLLAYAWGHNLPAQQLKLKESWLAGRRVSVRTETLANM